MWELENRELYWPFDEKNYISDMHVSRVIKKIKANAKRTDIFLDLDLVDWGKNTSVNPLNRLGKKNKSDLISTRIKQLKKVLETYKIKFAELNINEILIKCLPAFEDVKIERLYLKEGYHTILFANEEINIVCKLISESSRVDMFNWGLVSFYHGGNVAKDILSALSKTKIIHQYKPVMTIMIMDLLERRFFYEILDLNNLESVKLDFEDVSNHHRSLIQRAVNKGKVKKIFIEKLTGFSSNILFLLLGSNRNVVFSFKIKATEKSSVLKFDLVLPMIQTKSRFLFNFMQEGRFSNPSFTRNLKTDYPLSCIIRALIEDQISTHRRVVQDIVHTLFSSKQKNEYLNEQKRAHIYSALHMLDPDLDY